MTVVLFPVGGAYWVVFRGWCPCEADVGGGPAVPSSDLILWLHGAWSQTVLPNPTVAGRIKAGTGFMASKGTARICALSNVNTASTFT